MVFPKAPTTSVSPLTALAEMQKLSLGHRPRQLVPVRWLQLVPAHKDVSRTLNDVAADGLADRSDNQRVSY